MKVDAIARDGLVLLVVELQVCRRHGGSHVCVSVCSSEPAFRNKCFVSGQVLGPFPSKFRMLQIEEEPLCQKEG